MNDHDPARHTAEAALEERLAAVWRAESPRVIARVARLVGDLGVAEDIAQDAFVAAIEKWRAEGLPPEPAAWLPADRNRQSRAASLIPRAIPGKECGPGSAGQIGAPHPS